MSGPRTLAASAPSGEIAVAVVGLDRFANVNAALGRAGGNRSANADADGDGHANASTNG